MEELGEGKSNAGWILERRSRRILSRWSIPRERRVFESRSLSTVELCSSKDRREEGKKKRRRKEHVVVEKPSPCQTRGAFSTAFLTNLEYRLELRPLGCIGTLRLFPFRVVRVLLYIYFWIRRNDNSDWYDAYVHMYVETLRASLERKFNVETNQSICSKFHVRNERSFVSPG